MIVVLTRDNLLEEQITEYKILDFSEWQDKSKLDEMFRRLLNGLELF